MGIWNLVTGGITSLVGKYFDNKQAQQEQKHTQKMQCILGKQDWEITAVAQMAQSFKDEWFMFIFSLPLILTFISPLVDLYMLGEYSQGMFLTAAQEGLQGLESCPTWYVSTIMMMVGVSFGTKGFHKVLDIKNKFS